MYLSVMYTILALDAQQPAGIPKQFFVPVDDPVKATAEGKGMQGFGPSFPSLIIIVIYLNYNLPPHRQVRGALQWRLRIH